MKVKMFLVTIVLLGLFLVSGCAAINDVVKFNPFATTEKVAETTYDVKDVEPLKSREEIIKLVEDNINNMVKSINRGNWDDAIRDGEEGYEVITGSDAQAVVKDSAYVLISTEEKLFETLVEAYDYKTHLEGLSSEEKEKYVRAAKAHLNIDPAEPFKKLALAKVLIDTGDYEEGLRLTAEIYNSDVRNNFIVEQYAWALYRSGRKPEAYDIYKKIYPQPETLTQLYHSAIVMEEIDKRLGLILYKGCIGAGNNLMVLEPNVKNFSAQSYINSVITGSQKAFDRLMAGGLRIDSPYNPAAVDSLIRSVVTLSAQ